MRYAFFIVIGCWLAAAQPARADEPAPSAAALVTVHLSADDAWLERSDGPASNRFELVCLAPCDQQVPAGGDYRVAGDGPVATPRFSLTRDSRVDVSLKSVTREFAGAWVTIGGGGLLLWSALFLVIGALNDDSTSGDYYFLGGVIGGVGVGLGVLGLLLLLVDNDTSLRIIGSPASAP